MKKTLYLIFAGLMLTAVLAACGGEATTTLKNNTTDGGSVDSTVSTTTTKAPVTTTGAVEGVTTTADPDGSKVPETDGNTPETTDGGNDTPIPGGTTNLPDEPETPEVTTTEKVEPETPEVPEKTALTWYDNNEGLGKQYYDITVNADGSVHVAYTKQTAAEAESSWGYSWANMAADVSEVYTDQTKLVLKVQGTAGKTILVKPFDNQTFEKTVTFDGSVQTVTITLNNVPGDAPRSIIIFGDGGAVDTSGSFTILDAYFE
ncbi:MAG: hypothetical protein IJX76_02085 [Clostridia bacterium]|nr:hypothetical protein [Clostridia bacterium]